jgi:hypothetical protein
MYAYMHSDPNQAIYRCWQDDNLVWDNDILTATLPNSSATGSRCLLHTIWNDQPGNPYPTSPQYNYVSHVKIQTQTPSATDAQGNPMIGSEGLIFTPLKHLTFESGTVGTSAEGSDAYDSAMGTPDRVEYSNTYSKYGSQSSRYEHQIGDSNRNTGSDTFISPRITDEFWCRAYVYFPSGWVWPRTASDNQPTEGMKFMRCQTTVNGSETGSAWDCYIYHQGLIIATGLPNPINDKFYSDQIGGSPDANNYCPWDDFNQIYRQCQRTPKPTASGVINRGVWHNVEFYIKYAINNTGIIRAWLNGDLMWENVGVQTAIANGDGLYSIKFFAINDPGLTQANQYSYIDDVIITDGSNPPPNLDASGNKFIGDWTE